MSSGYILEFLMNKNFGMKFNSFEQLANFPVDSSVKREKPMELKSQKEEDIFCRELLEQNPELRKRITDQMQELEDDHLPMPVAHITSGMVRSVNGDEVNTGFVENINTNGFRKRDTNVSAFVRRDEKSSLAEPNYYATNPEEFIKSLRLFLKRYVHHGFRTNKKALNNTEQGSRGVPTMLVITGGLSLERGSDYDDHYILREGATKENIIGEIHLDGRSHHRSREDVEYIAEKMLDLIHDFYSTREESEEV